MTPARPSTPAKALDLWARSRFSSRVPSVLSAARTSRLRGVSTVSSSNRQATSPRRKRSPECVFRISIRPRTRFSVSSYRRSSIGTDDGPPFRRPGPRAGASRHRSNAAWRPRLSASLRPGRRWSGILHESKPDAAGITLAVAEAEVAPETNFQHMAQKARDQRLEIGSVLNLGVEAPQESRQIVGIQKQEPNIAHRYLVINKRRNVFDHLIGSRHSVHRSCKSCTFDFAALSGLSNQYSSRSGPISVSTTPRNHTLASATRSPGAGVT